MITAAHRALLDDAAFLAWLKNERGLIRATVEHFRLGRVSRNLYPERAAWGLSAILKDDGTPKKLFIPAGLLIPGPERIRIRRPDGDEDAGRFGRYHLVKGSGTVPLVIGAEHPPEETPALVVESELDAMLLFQELPPPVCIIALGTTAYAPDDNMQLLLAGRPAVLIALDNDEAGFEATRRKWLSKIPNAKPAPLVGGKDPTEAFVKVDLSAWYRAALRLNGVTLPPVSGSERPEQGKVEGREARHVRQESPKQPERSTTTGPAVAAVYGPKPSMSTATDVLAAEAARQPERGSAPPGLPAFCTGRDCRYFNLRETDRRPPEPYCHWRSPDGKHWINYYSGN